jgi:hypothetical protein
MALSKYDRETLRINHQVSLQPQLARQKKQDEAHKAQIAAAQAGLKAALAADKAAGLADSAALRDIKPVRPAILDVTLEWDASSERRAKFEKMRSESLNAYYEHLVIANPALLSPEQLRELPAAIRFCDEQVKAAEAQQ